MLDAGAFSVSLGSMVHIKTITASSSSTIQFQDGSSGVTLDNTYPLYLFKIINMHPSVDNHIFEFQANASGGSGYNETITSTVFRALHTEGGGTAELSYRTTEDLGQSTDHQHLANGVGNSGGSRGLSGELFLYNPSNTTFVKHFMARCQFYEASDASVEHYTSGYFNTTSAIDEIQFRMASGNIDDGTFKLYGIKDS
tara:strand:- start:1027 stop:1620 length:594 start_codon:yes stop_codon:yes gene_type:complete